MKKIKPLYLFLSVLLVLTFTACSQPTNTASNEVADTKSKSDSEADNAKEETKEEIAITSSSLTEEGKWLSVITKSKGENKSPQLSWTPVENASCYAIYMFDKSAGNWLHWVAKDVTVTELELGAELENSEYVGPYPPSGIHEYVITVVALSASPDTYEGKFDNKNKGADKIIQDLDIANGKPGNILAIGSISGTYKSGAIVE